MNHPLSLLVAALLAAGASAQAPQAIVYTLQDAAVGLDAPNERSGGSINDINPYALTSFVPGNWPTALTWLPASSQAALRGDPDSTGDYSVFEDLRSVTTGFHFAGVFFKHADKGSADITRAFFTVQDTNGHGFTVWTGGGAQSRVILPGDWFRWLPNGDVEIFITQAQIQNAAGPQPGAFAAGAIAICQDANGDLYYSPTRTNGGGHWVSGNGTGSPIFANDGSICRIPASAITYDAAGNVQSIAGSSAQVLWEETQAGPGGVSVRGLVNNAAHNDITGAAAGDVTFNLTGLELDPGGGTVTASYQDAGAPIQVPNLLFTFDNPWVATVFSTANNVVGQPGSIAVINGVRMGEDTPGVPATGAWVGTQSSVISPGQFGNVTPTLKGLAVIDAPSLQPPVLDATHTGAVSQNNPALELDIRSNDAPLVFINATIGPGGPGGFARSTPLNGLPGGVRSLFHASSFPRLFTVTTGTTIQLTTLVAGANGYATLTAPGVWNASLVGSVIEFQSIAPLPSGALQLSNPVQVHVK